jgi:hypothetical protein
MFSVMVATGQGAWLGAYQTSAAQFVSLLHELNSMQQPRALRLPAYLQRLIST